MYSSGHALSSCVYLKLYTLVESSLKNYSLTWKSFGLFPVKIRICMLLVIDSLVDVISTGLGPVHVLLGFDQ